MLAAAQVLSAAPCALRHKQAARMSISRSLPGDFGSCAARREVALTAVRLARPPAPPARLVRATAAAGADAATLEADAPSPRAEAHLRFQRGSPHKMRRVLDQIRGRSYEEALMLLEYMPFRACEPVLKTLVSAAANAKNNLGLRKAKLVVSECFADGGPQLKRVRPRAKGRASKILKPMVHLTIRVQER